MNNSLFKLCPSSNLATKKRAGGSTSAGPRGIRSGWDGPYVVNALFSAISIIVLSYNAGRRVTVINSLQTANTLNGDNWHELFNASNVGMASGVLVRSTHAPTAMALVATHSEQVARTRPIPSEAELGQAGPDGVASLLVQPASCFDASASR